MPSQSRNQSRRASWINLIALLVLSSTLAYYTAAYWSEDPVQHPDTRPISSLRTQSRTCNGTPHFKRVAVIGAGSAGTSTAYYLARAVAGSELDPCTNLSITIFERNGYIGGRSTTVYPYTSNLQHQTLDESLTIASQGLNQQPPLELGASVFVKVNTNLLHAAEALNLTVQSAGRYRPGMSPYGLGVWDGSSFRFLSAEKDSWWLELGKLLYRYGLAPLRTQRAMKDMVSHFQKMYSAPIFPWSSLTEAVRTAELDHSTSITGRAFLAQKGIGDAFAEDLIQASTRVNYAQNLEQIHGVETMVCMAAEGGTMSIEGGNWQIFAGMAVASGADIRLNTTVLALSSIEDSKEGFRYAITSTDTPSSAELNPSTLQTDNFHDVVLATPLQFSHIDSENLSPSLHHLLPSPISYVRLHVTLLATPRHLSPSFFKVSSRDLIPETILTTLPLQPSSAPPQFFSISTLRNLINPHTGRTEYAYKIFSAQRITAGFLSDLFDLNPSRDREGLSPDSPSHLHSQPISWIHRHVWHSYPYLEARKEFDGPALGGGKQGTAGFWYTGGIESFISTMETSSLAGRNAAALMVREWGIEADRARAVSEGKMHAVGDDDHHTHQPGGHGEDI